MKILKILKIFACVFIIQCNSSHEDSEFNHVDNREMPKDTAVNYCSIYPAIVDSL
jgi:hypothetical protein